MSKRKAGVNDIIYELSNDDIDISSEDEASEAKIKRSDPLVTAILTHKEENIQESCTEVTNLDYSTEGDCTIVSPVKTHIGGKTSLNLVEPIVESSCDAVSPKPHEVDIKKVNSDCSKTTLFNEEVLIDSPASNSDLCVVGCENRTPLVTVKFKDMKMAKAYKEQVKAFMLNLMKLHNEESLTGSDEETDLELDVWPEDLQDDVEERQEEADSLFFVDTAPGLDSMEDVPTYRQNSSLISNIADKEPTPPPSFRRGPICFNCDGAHQLRDCVLPRNNMRIAEKRKNLVRVGRYHVEDDQKYGHLVPGRISGQLRHALGLKRHELPMYIYRMRMLGYPPGWLEEARISHSGITMFDSTGRAILDPEEEEGEVCEPGCKDKFDIKKILDFPGFNVPASSRYKEESHLYDLPPMSEQDSKMNMLQMLAPNAMKAYKRKKLTFFPSASNNTSMQEGQAEMDIDSGDEVADFPSVPPLPDEEPPPPPPPPPPLPLLPPGTDSQDEKTDASASADDIEVISVVKVNDIPVPVDDFITIDVDESVDDLELSQISSGLESPSLDYLEAKKRKLLDALKDAVSIQSFDVTSLDETIDSTSDGEVENEVENDREAKETNDNLAKKKSGRQSVETNGSQMEEANDDQTKETNDSQAKKTHGNPAKETNDDQAKGTNDSQTKETNDDLANETNDNQAKNINDDQAKQTNNIQAKNANDSQAKETKDYPAKAANDDQAMEINDDQAVAATDDSATKLSTSENTETSNAQNKTGPNSPDQILLTGHVKSSDYGTPVINIASPFTKLPSDDKFAKDICDVINFENLPNSTGKYKQICSLLKKVKSEVDRIQDS